MSSLSITADRMAIPGSAWTFQSALTLGALPTAIPCARLHTRNIAREWGLRHLADTAELVVSELVTNAVSASVDEDQRPHYTDGHGAACVRLRLSTDRRAVLVEVWDGNVMPPEPNQAGLDDESGRGLMLVEALAERWGWDLTANGRGKIVWALLHS
jgi:anti-sigma regulatory factor (Ser/Thr protein kinase)